MGRHHIVDAEYHSPNGTQTAAAAISLPNRGHVTSTGPWQVIINNRKHTGTIPLKLEDYAVVCGYNECVEKKPYCNKINFIKT